MKKQQIATIVVGVVIMSGTGFYGGTIYAKKGNPNAAAFRSGAGVGSFRGGPGAAGAGRVLTNGGFTAGEIISSDEASLTIQLGDQGSKTVYLSDETDISKMVEGSIDDLTNGTNITVMGSANEDGSVTAEHIQIRPEGNDGVQFFGRSGPEQQPQ